MKRCNTCGIEKSDDAFYPRERRWLHYECKECARKRVEEYRKTHKEKINTNRRNRWAKDAEYRAKKKAWKKANAEKVREQHRRYREKNKERLRQSRRLYSKEHYVPHPRPILSEEEKASRDRALARRYYHNNLDRVRARSRHDFSLYYKRRQDSILRRIAIKELRKILGARYRCPEDMVRAKMATILLKRKINKKPGGELQWPTLNSLSTK